MKKIVIPVGFLLLLSTFGFHLFSSAEIEKSSQQKKSIDELEFGQDLVEILKRPMTIEKSFNYRFGSRFGFKVSKTQLEHAKTVYDIIDQNAKENYQSFHAIQIGMLNENGHELYEDGLLNEEANFNPSQISLLRSLSVSDNFFLRAKASQIDASTQSTKEGDFANYITVVPEKEAEYEKGVEGFVDYLKKKSKKMVLGLNPDELGFGRIHFTVDVNGRIKSLKVHATSDLPKLDTKMIKIIEQAPGKWIPAEDAEGNPTAQEMVFFYGKMGC